MNVARKKLDDIQLLAAGLGLKPSRPTGPTRAERNSYWARQFSRLVELANQWGYDVELESGADDRVEMGDARTVWIDSTRHPETRCYTLLHELGHILVRRRWTEFSEPHPTYLHHPDAEPAARHRSTPAFRVGLVAEELEAWRRGRRLARRMGMRVDDTKWEREQSSALLGYISWAAHAGPVPRTR